MTVWEQLVGSFSTQPWLVTLYAAFAAGLVIFGYVNFVGIFAIWLERKVAGYIQARPGPLHTGKFHGVLQTLADGVKLMLKEDVIPAQADRLLFTLAPAVVFVGSFLVMVAIPFGPGVFVSDFDIGIFYVLAMSSIAVIGIIMAGWSSNNKWALYGGMRSVSQYVSFEVPLVAALVPVIIHGGTLSFRVVVEQQAGGFWNWNFLGLGNPFLIVSFLVYLVAGIAEVNRTPFDLAESESELVAGFHAEYSGMRFALFFMAEYANMFVAGALATLLFLGGWHAPLPIGPGDSHLAGILMGLFWFLLKSWILVFIMIWIRWTLPRIRPDQLMTVCWKYLLPITLVNLVLAAGWEALK